MSNKTNQDINPKDTIAESDQVSRRGCMAVVLALAALMFAGVSYHRDHKKARETINKTRAAIAQNDTNRVAYMLSADARNNAAMHEMRDSLNNVNWHLFNVAAEKYFDRIDQKYTLGRFFNANEIAGLNRVLGPYVESLAGESSCEYKFLKTNVPLRANTRFSTLLDIIGMFGMGSEDLAKFGMVAENGYLYMFQDQRRQDLFDLFVDDTYAGMMNEDGPNFDIREFAKIRDEYTRNARKKDSLDNVIYRGDSVIKANLRKFDAQSDSLNNVIKVAKAKLSR